jgi:hypothetical protein
VSISTIFGFTLTFRCDVVFWHGPIAGLLIIDNGHWAWPLFDNQSIDTALIEIWHIVA